MLGHLLELCVGAGINYCEPILFWLKHIFSMLLESIIIKMRKDHVNTSLLIQSTMAKCYCFEIVIECLKDNNDNSIISYLRTNKCITNPFSINVSLYLLFNLMK